MLPSDYPFINHEMDKKNMAALIDDLLRRYGLERITDILDKIKHHGFQYATQSGITWGIDDVRVPEGKAAIIEQARTQSQKVLEQYNNGLLSAEEKRRMNIEIWQKAKNDVEKLLPGTMDPNGSVNDMLHSGARGSLSQIVQMAGMKGLIVGVSGDTIEFPIIASMKEGLTPIEYFTTTHGARKGNADTALNTATAGYLTRRLFDVAQDAIVVEEDCGTKEGSRIRRVTASGIDIPFAKNLKGRVLAEAVSAGEVGFRKGHLLSEEDAQAIEGSDIQEVKVRSPMSCQTLGGICQSCYGADLTTTELVELGEAVGTIAAQAIGEPGTQLTMRTFHAGGIASVGGDITAGLPRVSEVFERRSPKNAAVLAKVSGTISDIVEGDEGERVITVLADQGASAKTKKETEYSVHFRRMILVKKGEKVEKGQALTDGSADLVELFKLTNKEHTQDYIINEINRIYELQGASISRKHIEVIIKQMFSRCLVRGAGDTEFTVGDVVEEQELEIANAKAKEEGKEGAQADPLILGITEVSLTRKSFLSAASFQHTTKVLINAAIRGSVDKLTGLKENVIIGRLIPAGTGFAESPKHERVTELQKVYEEEQRANEETRERTFVTEG